MLAKNFYRKEDNIRRIKKMKKQLVSNEQADLIFTDENEALNYYNATEDDNFFLDYNIEFTSFIVSRKYYNNGYSIFYRVFIEKRENNNTDKLRFINSTEIEANKKTIKVFEKKIISYKIYVLLAYLISFTSVFAVQ